MLVDKKQFADRKFGSVESDYDYLYEFFDDEDMLYKFCEYLDGIVIKIDFNTHKRIMCQKRLVEGFSTIEIAAQLDMKLGTVQKIRYRMLRSNLVAYSAISDKRKK